MISDIFNIVSGDIFDLEADALVFPASHKPRIGGSLDGHVYERAGKDQLLEERLANGYLHSGESCITDSYDLSTNYQRLIHTATPVYQPNHPTSTMHNLKKCYRSALGLAEENDLKTIVFVLLGAGASGFSHKKAIEAAGAAVEQYFTEHSDSHIESITVVVYEKESQYQLLIRFNEKLKEAKVLLDQIDDLKNSIQIDSYIGEIISSVAKELVGYADKEIKQIRQAYDNEIAKLSENETDLSPEDQIYKNIVKLPDGINQTELTGRIYVQDSSNISQIMNLYSKNGNCYKNASSFLSNKNNVLKLGLGLELSFDKMCWLMWCRDHEFPISELDYEISEYYIKQNKHLDALDDYEEEFTTIRKQRDRER